MKIIDILAQWFGVPAAAIRDMLTAVAAARSDLAEFANKLLAKLDESATPESLAALAAALPAELKNILLGKLNPRKHASDAG